MKEIYVRILLVLSIVFASLAAMAQRSSGLMVEGNVSVEEGTADGAIIQIFEDGKKTEDYGIPGNGNYRLELRYNHKFELIFQRENNFSQKIVVETDVPQDILLTNPKFPPFPVNITLFTEIPGIDKSFSENTVLKIFYSRSVDNFVSELYYNDAQIKRLIDQAILQGGAVDKNADFMSKLTRAELAELRKEYNELLEQAGKEYSSEKFLAALDGYQAASKILPNEQFPKDRIAEINDLLGLIMAAAELDKAMLERFNTLVKEGDLFFSQKNYPAAKNSYNRSLSIKPFDQYVNDQLQKIADLLLLQKDNERYNDLIAQGDKAIKELLYNEAINQFQQALVIKPNEQYPKTKIEEINGLLAVQQKEQEKQKNYKEAMFEGEKEFSKQFYDRALTSFQNALSYKPDDPIAARRIEETQTIMKGIIDKMAFDKFMVAADKAYKKKDYSEALSNYEEALSLFPNDPRAKKRAEEINQILYVERSFAEFVTQADKQFDAQSYSNAKSLYEKALAINSSDKHVLARIAEINNIAAQQGIEEQYKQAVAQADELLVKKEYENARGKYNEALEFKPKEQYPKDKIAEIGSALAAIAKTDKDYGDAVAKADLLFQQKKYSDAKLNYADAGQIKPDENYPLEMIAKIDGLIAEQARLAEEAAAAEAARLAAIQAEKDKNYTEAIARADKLFNDKEYDGSRNEYRTALDVKPEESYPQEQLDKIGNLLAQLSASQKAYEEAVALGDREFKKEGWDAAIAAYNTAKQAKADETYPGEQLTKIDSIRAERIRLAEEAAAAEAARLAAIQAEKDKNYAEAIARADKLFNDKEYDGSRNEYRTALEVKPEESYPQEQIDKIGNLLAQLSASQKAYEEAVALGDREFKKEGWDAAIAAYNTAKQAKADETYPGEQLAKIDSIVTTRARLAEEAAAAEAARLAAIQAEKDKNYTEAIARADKLFNDKEYDGSRNEYRTALDVKPEESYPQEQLDKIGNLLAQLSASQKAYEEAVALGDREFKEEVWDAAIAAYNTAKQAKADETYPGEQLAKIDSIVTTRARLAEETAAAEAARLAAIQAEKDKNYTEAIARADKLFNDKEYDGSRNEYRTALEVKPEESYPQEQLDKIGNLLAQLSASQKAYEEAVALGDREFKKEVWDAAIAAYNTAKQAKADGTYPDEQLTKIDSIRAERIRLAEEAAAAEAARLAAIQAEKDKNYTEAIARADKLFNDKEYDSSRNEYRAALEVKPEESYPQEQIDKIGNIMAQLSASQKAYEEAVALGDREFKEEVWDAAIAAYNTAKQAKADETYPGEQLAEIDSIVTTRARLAEEAAAAETARLAAIQAEKDKNYAEAIARADKLYSSEEYENSLAEYRTALDVKPNENYPQQRIEEIEQIIRDFAIDNAARLERDKKYGNLILQADRFFATKNYTLAQENYKKALELKADETYPKEKLAEVVQILAQSALDEKYRNVIVVADGHFRTQNYSEARSQYEFSLVLKPDEQYPQSQIKQIDDIVEKEQQLLDAEQAEAEDLASRKEAIAQMQTEIDEQKILEESGLNVLYDKFIKKADAFFNDQQYNVSRAWYFKARDLKPEESYPPQRIDEINRILSGLMLSQSDREYQGFIDLGDTNLRNNELAVARGWYNQALGQKPNEEYPKAQLAEIQRMVAERVAGQSQQQFVNYKTTADKAFEAKDFNVARFWYRKALELRSDDADVKARLAEINELSR